MFLNINNIGDVIIYYTQLLANLITIIFFIINFINILKIKNVKKIKIFYISILNNGIRFLVRRNFTIHETICRKY